MVDLIHIVRNSAGILDVIQYPCMTSKAKYLNEKLSQVVIFVEVDATKIEIKQAVTAIFGMEVSKIRTMRVKGKNKISARRYRFTEIEKKKAIVIFKDKEQAQKMSREDQGGIAAGVLNAPEGVVRNNHE
jgi:large subunit ribosomal protein L23